MVIVRPSLAVVHWAASGQVRQAARTWRSRRAAPAAARMGTVTPTVEVTVLPSKVDGEAVFGETAFDRGGRLVFDAVQPFQELTGAVGGIAVDRRLALACGR